MSYAVQQIESNFNNPVTLNITVAASPGTSILGESEPNILGLYTYPQIVSALAASATTANALTAVANLPMSDPNPSGGTDNYVVNLAEAQALGLSGSSFADSSAGTVSFGAGFTYTFDPNNRAVPGSLDFIGIAEHELTEVMGRSAGLGMTYSGTPLYEPYDLFRYTSPGVLNMTPRNNIYFSINGGTTNLMPFNFPNGNGSDPQDWANLVNDSFNAYAVSGVELPMSGVDLVAMDVLGYQRAAGLFVHLVRQRQRDELVFHRQLGGGHRSGLQRVHGDHLFRLFQAERGCRTLPLRCSLIH